MKFKVLYRDCPGEIGFEELLGNGTIYIGGVESSFMDNIAVYSGGFDGVLFLHDFTGRYRGVGQVYLDIGYDLRIDLFSEPDILLYGLKATLKYLGFRMPYWDMLMPHIIYSFRDSEEKTLDAFMRFLIYRVNESSGIERMAYTVLHNIFMNIFTERLLNIFSYHEYTSFKEISQPIFIGYDIVDNLLARTFLHLYTVFYIARRYPDTYHIITYGDAAGYIPRALLHNLFSVRGRLIHLTLFNEEISSLARYIVFQSGRYVDKNVLNRFREPIDCIGGEYLLFDKNVALILEASNVSLEKPIKRGKDVDTGDDYLSKYGDGVREILDTVNRFGEMSIDGIYINLSGYDMPLIASLVDRLWRDGYLRRVPGRGGVRYRITLKGIRFLRGVENE